MRPYRILTAALLGIMMLPAMAQAQVQVRIAHRGVLGIMTQPVGNESGPSRQRVIVRVVPGSPADAAGLATGDTIVSINRLAATEQVMSAPFEPGDTVVVRIRRSGDERDVTVVAGERAEQLQAFTVEVLPDSVLRHMQVIVDAVRSEMDTLRRRAVTVERLHGDSVMIFRFGGDSVPMGRIWHDFPPDSLRAHWLRLADSLRIHSLDAADSMRVRFHLSERARARGDSLAAFPEATFFRALPGEEGWGIAFADSARFVGGNVFITPGEMIAGGMTVGLRAVAGAELSELNPGLATYFGTSEGVLVLNAREGTPAARAGIAAGDVIVEIDGTKVSSIAELRRAFRPRAGDGGAVRMRLLRRGQHVDVEVPR